MTQNISNASGATDDSTDRSDDGSDNLTISSTPENSEWQDEWDVKRVLAEGIVEGTKKYLLEWTGYPLCDASWEPEGHLSPELLEYWRASVEKSGRTTVAGFRISDWKNAVEADIRAKYARHVARNRKRARLGLKERPLAMSLQEWIDSVQGPCDEELLEEDIQNHQPTTSNIDTSACDKLTSEDEDNGNGISTDVGNPETKRSDRNREVQEKGKEIQRRARALSPEARMLLRPRVDKQRSSNTELDLEQRREAIGAVTPLIPGQRGIARNAATSSESEQKKKQQTRTLSKISVKDTAGSKGISTTSNIFIGGKRRKPRRRLLDAVTSQNQHSKLLNYHKRWIIEKGLRDKEGVTPPNQLNASLPSTLVRVGSNPETDGPTIEIDQNKDALQRKDSSAYKESNHSVRKRVRWAENLENEQRTIREESKSLFVTDDENVPGESEDTSSCLSEAKKDMTFLNRLLTDSAAPRSIPCSGNVIKVCQFGSKTTMKLEFLGWMINDESSWSCQLNSQPRLMFSHLCSMQDLRSQNAQKSLEETIVCQGVIGVDPSTEPLFCSLVRRLRLGQLAAICHADGVSIALHNPDTAFMVNSTGNSYNPQVANTVLHYFLFMPHPPVSRLMLAPLPALAEQEGSLSAYNFFLGDTYERTFNFNTAMKITQSFFLAFPQSAYQEAIMISQWLREADSSCEIRSSLVSGHWSEFLTFEHGNVIFHEDALWIIRSMPYLGSVLHGQHGNINFWVFTRAHTALRRSDGSAGLRDYRLRQIFRSGSVFLVTPSFVVSQPEQAYHLVKFFWQNYTHHSWKYRAGKLAVASDFSQWLLDLAIEKAELSSQHTKSDPNARHTVKASKALFKCLSLVKQLTEASEDYDDSPFVYAPDVLNGNDEQSLINWFGSWSLSHHHQFRKFFVVGSSNQSKARLTRNLQPVQLKSSVEDEPSCSSSNIFSKDHLQPQEFLIADISRMQATLATLEKTIKLLSFSPMVLYRYPVTNRSSEIQPRLEGSHTSPENYRKWLDFFMEPFFGKLKLLVTKRHVPHNKNTYVGLFYTTNCDEPSKPLSNSQQTRPSPWIAIYRPTDIQQKPWKEMELLIWDPNLVTKIQCEDELYEGDLTSSQRQLINCIQEATGDKTTALPLERVWLGAFGGCENENRENQIDVVLSWMEDLVNSIKHWLPICGSTLPGRGWRHIRPGLRPVSSITKNISSPVGPSASNSVSLPIRTILLPPGANSKLQAEAYRNQWRDVILKWEGKKPLSYTFQPTLKWYNVQLEAGMGFQHILVATWQTIFVRYGIPVLDSE